MSIPSQSPDGPEPYPVADPESALKYAVQHIASHRAEIVEGRISPVSLSWGHETVVDSLRRQLGPVTARLGCIAGSGSLDLPGSGNWFVPGFAVVPRDLARASGALVPDQTLLIVQVTSASSADTDRVVKRRRYAEYRAPLYLVVDRGERTCTLFSRPGELGYSRVDGPLRFGEVVPLPEPFGLDLETKELE
ncbi:Uma2 family endonuclease [Streptomyces sp. SBT349]|uniref:Uma2 family endonuclease n=1 Tax=Streptomyces sp. SBT349 TaxID=1580539 RepID=UPI000AEEF409|nr:Uma2 family endonuclease [Streptomyces sp. SBT349]